MGSHYSELSRTVTERGMTPRDAYAMLTGDGRLGNLSSVTALAAMRDAFNGGTARRGACIVIHDGWQRDATEYRADTATFRVVIDR